MSENTSTPASGAGDSTKDLKRTLGRGDLMGTAVGQIIGAGIMSLTGVAIGMTGRSVPLAFLVAALLTICTMVPVLFVGGTIRMRGGQYTQAALLVGTKFSGFYIIMFILSNLSIAMYALSFADYALAFLPTWNRQVLATLLLTFFYVLNLVGIDFAAKAQNLIVILMVVALTMFSIFGITKIDPNYLNMDGFFSNGFSGLMQAGALLAFATGGATVVVNLGAEAKNPTKDIPFVLVTSTLGVAVVYGFMSIIAAGVLPIDRVAGMPLTLVAQEILPVPLYIFFVVGGAMFALISTLNAQLQWAPKPIMQACEDGWFPRGLAALNKARAPWKLLTIYYFIGMGAIWSGFDIGQIGSLTLVIGYVYGVVMALSVINIPKKVPEIWAKSTVHVNSGVLTFCGCLGALASLVSIYFLASDFTTPVIIANIVTMVVVAAYAYMRDKSGKVHMEVSYEAA